MLVLSVPLSSANGKNTMYVCCTKHLFVAVEVLVTFVGTGQRQSGYVAIVSGTNV